LEPGDCLVFHSRVLHCAPPNASTVRHEEGSGPNIRCVPPESVAVGQA
jgi:hypothetical protein